MWLTKYCIKKNKCNSMSLERKKKQKRVPLGENRRDFFTNFSKNSRAKCKMLSNLLALLFLLKLEYQ